MARLAGTKKREKYFRVNLTLPIHLDRVLADLGPTTWAKGGSKLPKTVIMRALVRLLMELKIDVSGVKTEEEFLERLRQSILNYKKK
ncbi:hypothetical protein AUJ66_08805 [Candidatus Desantisbacteria bacterium CG1_02_38_46]|uniref:Ribbon-helix-helix protein CopG domain-containing protein n=3 Tax=unclassified Candidatus Desantisiibacteriota TaxID=3106372 RepID=A0A2H9PB74_9BACT|nr:MAG: hypothetical protein AUJ66_08805 [Candidatus Desantisbacteria bacterium CG1_02_38_46]PIU51648.1 MAG: hypothetical protein COS91_03235 [Candidatus Desantisbacteria bacterium CG07_land_8_20_14_0_80_39_15]PIZ15960.1 MAG: hypothetical protein COY51_03775 [Candidatus Desantisbacteria bacterium CG_4_10_14_0_8_um_filter_39_17]